MTFTEKFDYLKKTYANKADISKLTEGFIAAQITLSDEDCGGTLYAHFSEGILNFEPYDYHDNTVAVIINSALLEDFLLGKEDPAKAYLDGKLQAWGNLDHALMIIESLKKKKRAACKKKTEKAEATEEVKTPKKRSCAKKAENDTVTEKAEKKTATKKSTTKKAAVKE